NRPASRVPQPETPAPNRIPFPRFPTSLREATAKFATACSRPTSVIPTSRFPPKNQKGKRLLVHYLPSPVSGPLSPDAQLWTFDLRPSTLDCRLSHFPRFPPGSDSNIYNQLSTNNLRTSPAPPPTKKSEKG